MTNRRGWNLRGPRAMVDPEVRFWEKVDKSGECWMWQAASNGKGYGVFYLNGRQRPAHRVSFVWANGPISDELQVDHMCHTPACVNPDHLRATTVKQNGENRAGAQSRSATGVRGVRLRRHGRYEVYAVHHYKFVCGGTYGTLEEADHAAQALRQRLFTHSDMDGAA